ncbi:hypothetical protein ACFSDD_09270 [Salipiger marinus]|uniref:hypothetical protein n=1 Tax=Salipiger marinus TaxID=555512 RepID=UPI003633ADF7
MTTLIRLNTAINNPSLPKLSDYGYLPPEGLDLSGKMKSSALENAAGEDMTLHSGAGAPAPTFAEGIYTIPNPSAGYNFLRCGTRPFGLGYTAATIIKRTHSQFYFLQGLGDMPSIFFSGANAQVFYPPLGSTSGIVPLSADGSGVDSAWRALVFTVREDGVAAVGLNGQLASKTYAELGADPSGTSDYCQFGKNSTTQGIGASFAFLGFHTRAMSDDEMVAYRRGLLAFAAGKGITIDG